MKIRPSQLQTFEDRAEQEQTLAIARILRRDIPAALPEMTTETFHQRIRYARQLGLDFLKGDLRAEADRKALMLWIRLMFEAGPGFMRHPACRAVLEDAVEPRPERIVQLLRVDRAVPWQAIKHDPALQAWLAELG